jgi:hypothetical protein
MADLRTVVHQFLEHKSSHHSVINE